MAETVWFNGSFVDKDEVRISPDDRGFLFADGLYEVVRSYAGRPFQMEAHLSRLADGLAALRIEGVEPRTIGSVCAELLSRNGLEAADAVLYVQVTRGVAPRVHHFPPEGTPPTVYVAARAFTPSVDPATGVSAITAPDHRWTRCDIKSVSLLPNCLAAQRARDEGAYEAVLVRDGVALEGTRTSFFAVIGGVVRTAPRSTYILPGVTRSVVLRLCREHGIPVDERPVLLEECGRADELFFAGTTTEVLPIVRLDGHPVGSGRPGPVSLRLSSLFRELVAKA
jgi:D-alanine transaminase